MKFTEGYWLPSEKANASHAMQAYEVEQIPGGMRKQDEAEESLPVLV